MDRLNQLLASARVDEMWSGRQQMQSAIKTALVATALALTLAGCETIGERTELGENAQIGAAVGSAAVGLVAILADAHPAIAVGAALLGGVGGGFLGDRLEEDDPNSED